MAIVRDAAAGRRAVGRGATLLQLRDPAATLRNLEREADHLVTEASVPVLISGRVDLALACGAAGVHLPEHDLPVASARRLLGSHRLLGRSVHGLDAACEAESQGADYLVFGPVFATATHPGRAALGLAALRAVAGAVLIPVLAIGGVDPVRAAACLEAGAAGFAAIRYFS
jgi:thiamine-phosphate pyrophosphorylase